MGKTVPCEMCGASGKTRRILLDKTVLQVCPNCERFGQVLEGPASKGPVPAGNVPMAMERRRAKQTTRDVFSTDTMRLEMVEDFAQRIRMAREKKGWTRQDLGGKVGEREVTIGRFENGTLHPPDDVAKRIERELGIKLFEAVAATATKTQAARNLTLGDMLRDAMRKKDE